VLAAPLARPLGVEVALWFAHWRDRPVLRLAERVSTVVFTVDRRTFPVPSPKVRPIGHGIDVSEFTCARDGPGHADLRVVALGRYARAKGLEAIVRAIRLGLDEGLDLRLEVHGPALTAEERAHRRALEQLVAELGLERRVRLGHALLRSEVPDLFARADVLVNNMRAGATDKVVYEAGASCLPVIASNPAFDTLLEPAFRFPEDDARALVERLRSFAALPEEERRRVGRALRERVAAGHSVERWADAIVEAVA
jgi:colanic acid/amylovoran biosynthesis glycosyltransferase